jgi:hypothetical protein
LESQWDLSGHGDQQSVLLDLCWDEMDHNFLLNTLLILWILGWSSFLITIWVWMELREIKSNSQEVTALKEANKLLESRVEGMERFMMRNGYRPPHKR